MLPTVLHPLLLGEASSDVDWSSQVALLMGMIAIGFSATGPVIVGWLYDHNGNYDLAFRIALVLYLVSVVAVIVTPRPPVEFRVSRP